MLRTDLVGWNEYVVDIPAGSNSATFTIDTGVPDTDDEENEDAEDKDKEKEEEEGKCEEEMGWLAMKTKATEAFARLEFKRAARWFGKALENLQIEEEKTSEGEGGRRNEDEVGHRICKDV